MPTIKWQCTQCGGTRVTQGLRPSIGSFCGKAKDNKHKWVKVTEKRTKWQCRQCGGTQITNGLRPSIGSFCGKSTDKKHKWSKVPL